MGDWHRIGGFAVLSALWIYIWTAVIRWTSNSSLHDVFIGMGASTYTSAEIFVGFSRDLCRLRSGKIPILPDGYHFASILDQLLLETSGGAVAGVGLGGCLQGNRFFVRCMSFSGSSGPHRFFQRARDSGEIFTRTVGMVFLGLLVIFESGLLAPQFADSTRRASSSLGAWSNPPVNSFSS